MLLLNNKNIAILFVSRKLAKELNLKISKSVKYFSEKIKQISNK